MTDPFERIAESKKVERRRLAALPVAEKLRLLERLRDREALLITSRTMPDLALLDRVMLVRESNAAYGPAEAMDEQHGG
jgi:hypothetical protein